MLLSAGFTAKFVLVFALKHWKTLFEKSQEKQHKFFWKMSLGIFTGAFHLRDRHVSIWQSVKTLNVFNTLTLKRSFWKNFFSLNKLQYCFLVESTKIENASFPYKTAISKANVKTSRMMSTKWTNHKERKFASNYFVFLKILFQFKNLL